MCFSGFDFDCRDLELMGVSVLIDNIGGKVFVGLVF